MNCNQSEQITIEHHNHKRTILVDFTVDDYWEIESIDSIMFMDSVHDMKEDLNDIMDYQKDDIEKALTELRNDSLEQQEINARF